MYIEILKRPAVGDILQIRFEVVKLVGFEKAHM